MGGTWYDSVYSTLLKIKFIRIFGSLDQCCFWYINDLMKNKKFSVQSSPVSNLALDLIAILIFMSIEENFTA